MAWEFLLQPFYITGPHFVWVSPWYTGSIWHANMIFHFYFCFFPVNKKNIFFWLHWAKAFPFLIIFLLCLQGFTLEDATGLAIKGDVDIHSVYATNLPASHPSFSLQRVLEMSSKWKAEPLPARPVHLFIGVLSATNHFAERMAIRKTWMQSSKIRSSNVVARFFVALVWYFLLSLLRIGVWSEILALAYWHIKWLSFSVVFFT